MNCFPALQNAASSGAGAWRTDEDDDDLDDEDDDDDDEEEDIDELEADAADERAFRSYALAHRMGLLEGDDDEVGMHAFLNRLGLPMHGFCLRERCIYCWGTFFTL